MNAVDLVRLSPLMQRNHGIREITIALIDGPIFLGHPQLSGIAIREIGGKFKGACSSADTIACMHGTFVAGILSAHRDCRAPAICPGCTLLLRPIFSEAKNGNEEIPSSTPEDLAEAVIDSVDSGARLINLSAALVHASPKREDKLQDALDYAVQRGAITVAAAGNQGTLGSSVITRHPGVIPVVACNSQGRPLNETSLGASIGKRGLTAPGQDITSLGANGGLKTSGGTSAAAPFVTGTLALLWSEFPRARSAELRSALAGYNLHRRSSVVPPLLNAWAAYQSLAFALGGKSG